MRVQSAFYHPSAFWGGLPFMASSPFIGRHQESHDWGHMRSHRRHHHAPDESQEMPDLSGIPDDFWLPVSPAETAEESSIDQACNSEDRKKSNSKSKNSSKGDNSEQDSAANPRVRIIPIEYKGQEYINISDDEECIIVESKNTNNNGKVARSRRRSLSKPEYLNECPGACRGIQSMENLDNLDNPNRSETGQLRNGKIRSGREIHSCSNQGVKRKSNDACDSNESRTNSSAPDCVFESKEEEIQFNELVQFFSDGLNSKSGTKATSSGCSVEPTPSYPAYDIIRRVIGSEGRVVDYIRGDGNCLFRALSKVIYGAESSHVELRQAVVDLVEKYPGEFEQFLDDGCIRDHIKGMRKVGTWGTQVEIYAAATLLQRDIYILSPDHTEEHYRWLLFSPRFTYPGAKSYDRCYITLCHTNGNHYDRIASRSRSCNCSVTAPTLNGVRTEVDLTVSSGFEEIPEVV